LTIAGSGRQQSTPVKKVLTAEWILEILDILDILEYLEILDILDILELLMKIKSRQV